MRNMLTVDVEDWQQTTVDQRLPISERPITISATKFIDGDEDLTASLPRIAALLSEQERRILLVDRDVRFAILHMRSAGSACTTATDEGGGHDAAARECPGDVAIRIVGNHSRLAIGEDFRVATRS